METSRVPQSHSRRDRQAGRNSVVPALGFSLLALLGALMPPVVFAADPAVGTQRNALVVFVVLALLVVSVAAGLFFASPLRKRLVPSREPISDELHPLRDGEVPAGMTHAWPAPGRSAPSYARPAALGDAPRPTYEPTPPVYEPTRPAYEAPPATYQPPPTNQPPAALQPPSTDPGQPMYASQPIHGQQAPALPQPTVRPPWPAAQPTASALPAQPVQRVEQPPNVPVSPAPMARPRPPIAPWSTGAPTTDPNWPRKPS